MSNKELRRLENRVAHAGAPQNRQRALRTAIDTAVHYINRLQALQATRCVDFRRRLEEWMGYPVSDNLVPYALPHETRVARLLRIAGWIAVTLECLLAIPLSLRAGLPWWSGVLLASALAVVLHGGFTIAFRRSQRPRESYANLRKWLLLPALVLSMVSILVLLFARTASGAVILSLAALIGMSLWTATVGLVLLGAALLVASDIYDWSRKDAKEYAALETEHLDSQNYRREWSDDLALIEASQARVAATGAEQTVSDLKNRIALPPVVSMLLLGALLSLASLTSGCQITETGNHSPRPVSESGRIDDKPPQPVTEASKSEQTTMQAQELDVYLDISGSLDELVYQNAIRNFLRGLAKTVEQLNLIRLTIFQFGADGWNAEEKLRLELPRLVLPKLERLDAGETEAIFGSAGQEADKQAAQAQAFAEAQAREAYRKALAEALAPVTEEQLFALTQSATQAICTDVSGVFNRVANSTGSRIALVITDGHESCRPTISKIPKPEGGIALIVALGPSKGKNGHEDFEAQRQQITSACSWALIVPHFRLENLNAALNEATSRTIAQATSHQ